MVLVTLRKMVELTGISTEQYSSVCRQWHHPRYWILTQLQRILVLKPYWNDFCKEVSSQLLLPVETDSPDLGLNSLSTFNVSTIEKILVLDNHESCPESQLTAAIL